MKINALFPRDRTISEELKEFKEQNPIIMQRQHLLITGAPRSGTTLIASMVGRHGEVAVLNEDEGWAMNRIVGKTVVGNKRCIPNQIDVQKNPLFASKFLKNLRLIRECPASRYCIEDYLQLPNPRIIGVIRHGNDVISSIMKRGGTSFRVASYRWLKAVEILHEIKDRHKEKVLIVAFEDAVKNPEPNQRRIAAFLGLEYQPKMLEGPKYNWYYPTETTLNEEKINRFQREHVDFKLEEMFPRMSQKYEELRILSKAHF